MTTARSARTKGLITYPNKISKILGEWYYGNKKALVRSRSSGIYGKKHQHHKGDIEVDLGFAKTKRFRKRGDFPFCVECKHDKTWDWKSHVWAINKKSFILKAFKQSFQDSLNKKDTLIRYPIVIFTKNYEKDYIVYPVIMYTEFNEPIFEEVDSPPITEVFPFLELKWHYNFSKHYKSVLVRIMRLDHFTKSFSYKEGWKDNLAVWGSL